MCDEDSDAVQGANVCNLSATVTVDEKPAIQEKPFNKSASAPNPCTRNGRLCKVVPNWRYDNIGSAIETLVAC